jgi:Protein of unknown function (DUF664)
MAWIAPVPERSDPPYVADERRRFASWLDARHNGHADLIRELVDGVTGL